MKKNKNIIIFLVLLSMCVIAILVYKIISIYAVFHSNVGAKAEFRNGAWNIDVNGKKITTGVQTDFTIDQITVAEDQHTMPGKISPGLSGNFKIVINPKDTNVSIRYDITLNQDELKSSNVKISSVEEKNNGAKLIKTAENEYTGIITLQDIQKNVIHEIEMNVVEKDLWIQEGCKVGGFEAANEAIGTLVLKFDDEKRLEQVLSNQDNYVKVNVI